MATLFALPQDIYSAESAIFQVENKKDALNGKGLPPNEEGVKVLKHHENHQGNRQGVLNYEQLTNRKLITKFGKAGIVALLSSCGRGIQHLQLYNNSPSPDGELSQPNQKLVGSYLLQQCLT